jgi:hypothetical protein
VAGQQVLNSPNGTLNRECGACVEGRFSDSSDSDTCTDCPLGKYILVASSPYCDVKQPCNPGKYDSDVESNLPGRCVACLAGQYSSLTNMESCTRCAVDTFQAANGSTFCSSQQQCGAGTRVVSNGSTTTDVGKIGRCPHLARRVIYARAEAIWQRF